MATPEQSKAEIIGLVSQYNADVRATREDLTLSPLGRYRRLESLYTSARDRVARLRGDLDQGSNGDRRELERRLFGLPRGADASDVVSFRDATDRVAQVKGADALGELMERASTSGDEMLLRAGFARAWQESTNPLGSDQWAGLVDEYAAQYPAVVRDLDALRTLTTTRGATRAFMERMGMTVTKPQELNRPEAAYSDQTPSRGDRPQLVIRGA